MPHLEINEVVLVHCSIVNILYICVTNKLFGQLIDISQKKYIFMKILNSEFSYIDVWFSDQSSKMLKF